MSEVDSNLMTQADYARWRKSRGLPGGTREAVRRAIVTQRISAFGPAKLIEPSLADAQWEQNTRARAWLPPGPIASVECCANCRVNLAEAQRLAGEVEQLQGQLQRMSHLALTRESLIRKFESTD